MLTYLQSQALPSTLSPAPQSKPTNEPAPNQKLIEDLNKTKEHLVNDEIKQRKIMSALFSISKRMKRIVTEKSEMVQERLAVEAITKELATAILTLELSLQTQRTHLHTRLSTIYKFGTQGAIRFLFSSQSSADLERNLKVLGAVAKQDLELTKAYANTLKELEQKRIKFQVRLAYLKSLEEKIKSKEQKLASENTSKARILDGIKNSKKFALDKLSKLRQKTQTLVANDDSGVLDLLFRPAFFERKGTLPTPVSGKLLQGFGILRDPEYNVVLSHKGIFLGTPEGSEVRAVFPGKVSYIGEIQGLGKTLILDHGDHYYSVYSCAKSFGVKVGDEIKENFVIAKSGLNPENSIEGLYFEIRHFSEPYDPKVWVKGPL
jgi:septal ring factor EnvC (AmiA/AmiB activator)